MKKLTLNIDALRVQSFPTGETAAQFGTVEGFAGPKNTGIDDTDCSAIDACASARGCTVINCPTGLCDTYDPALCPSVIDACPSRGCSDLFAC